MTSTTWVLSCRTNAEFDYFLFVQEWPQTVCQVSSTIRRYQRTIILHDPILADGCRPGMQDSSELYWMGHSRNLVGSALNDKTVASEDIDVGLPNLARRVQTTAMNLQPLNGKISMLV